MPTKARLLLRERSIVSDNRFVELVVWQLPAAVPGSGHEFKYRLAFVVDEICVLRFDNETGKGDHVHIGNVETPYTFIDIQQLLSDFWSAVETWGPT
jgi:hypothetical protein